MRVPRLRTVRESTRGITLVELLIAAALSAFLVAGLLVTLIAVQKNFRACEHHVGRQMAQLRVLDYLALDLRRALTVDVSGGQINLTVPNYYDPFGNPRDPTIHNGTIDYGDSSKSIAVSYYKRDDTIYRRLGSVETALASEVTDLNVQFNDLGQVIEVSVTFVPTFRLVDTGDAVRDGTAAYTRVLLRNKRRY